MQKLCIALLFFVAATCAADEIDVYGFNIHYTDTGSGPTLVLLHGLWGGNNEWEAVIEPLAAGHRVITMDALGFHGSDKPEARYHNALLAQFLAGFLESMELRDVTFMGHAMGANLATYTAVHHPERISRLVLIDGAGYRNPERKLAEPPSERMLAFMRVATGSSVAATEQFLRRRVHDPSLVTRDWAEAAFSMWLNSARAIGDMLREGGDLTESEMQTITLPTHIVWGADDGVFPIANAERLKNDINGATLEVIAESGHLPQLEQTDAFLESVLRFLETTN